MATKNIFMSYSRRELGFVDDLVSKLEEKQYQVWLDYRILIPGSPWADQIDKGLKDADTVLLVVSKASLASEFVALEWRHFLETEKRVILLIFEAVDIPTELEKYEWVDFRGSYQVGLKELFSQLTQPIQEEHPVPESGFKAPWEVWATIVLSVIVAFISLSAFWTIFIPLILIPLPYKIYKRSFDFMRVQASLLALPLSLTIAAFVYLDPEPDLIEAIIYGFETGIWGWVLLAVLRSAPLQRWGKPESTVPKFANPFNPNIMNPTPTPFFVDYAPEDSAVADELTAMLKKYGHPQAESIQSAKAVLVLISRYKSDTMANPVNQVVFPVMIQGNDTIAKKLSRVQWIDFRPGVKGLNRISQLLPDPTALLKALGMRPVSSLSVYPPMITALLYFIIIIAVINIGAVLDYLFFSGVTGTLESESANLIVAVLVGSVLFFTGLSLFMAKGLISRTGLFSNSKIFFAGLIFQGLLMFGIVQFDNYVYNILADAGIDVGFTFTYFGTIIYIIGITLLAVVYFGNRFDIKRWFPKKV
jgi:hypothetical protein